MSDAARVPGGTITSLLGRYFPALARMSESSRRMNMRLMFELVRGGFLMLLIVLASPPFGSELPLSGGPSPGSSDDAAAIAKDRKSTRLNSSHTVISYAVFCLK